MQAGTSQPLISTDNLDFIEKVEGKIKQGEPIIILLRHNNQNGNRTCFLVRDNDEFHQVLQKTLPKDALSAFFSPFFAQGVVTHELKDRVVFLEKIVQDDEDSIVVIRLDTNNFLLDTETMKNFSEPKQENEWFNQNLGVPVIVALLTYWEDNSEQMITAYVRDIDGQIRCGTY
jgi:hypothetical protein